MKKVIWDTCTVRQLVNHRKFPSESGRDIYVFPVEDNDFSDKVKTSI